MKKLNFLLILLTVIFTGQMYLAQSFTLSSCSDLGSNTYGPMNSTTTANSKNRTAFIIPASQLAAINGGTITSTFFKRVTDAVTLTADTTFKIYLKNVTSTDFGTGSPTWATEIGTATLVYDSNPQTAVGSTSGWKQFTHSTNFVYTAGSNLAVFVEYVQTTAQTAAITWNYEFTAPCISTTNSNTTKYSNTTGAFTATLTSTDYRRPLIAFNVTLPPATVAPACSTVTAPANAAVGVTLTPTITWGAAANAHSYIVKMGTTAGGTDILNSVNVGLTTSYAIPASSPLLYNGTYYVTVTPTNNIGTATGCIESSFSTLLVPCPSVSSPANPTLGTSLKPTIIWSAVTGVTGYRLSVGTTSGGTDVLNNIDLGNVLNYTFASSLNPSTQYYYTVTGYQGTNSSSGCTVRNFTTGTTASPANDNCSGAIALTVNPNLLCGTVTAGNTLGATLSMAATPCFGNPDDDVWFSFVATSTMHNISLTNVVATGTSTSVDMYFNVLSGTCGTMTSVLCSDADSNVVTGLTPGQTYYVRVYNYGGAGSNNSFNICVGTPPPPPANDDCANATILTVNPNYSCGAITSGTTVSATQSTETAPTCGATGVNDDVWFKFTATNVSHRISLTNVSGTTDMAMSAYSGACGSLVHVLCSDPNTMELTGLTVGQEYTVRVWTYTSTTSTSATFDICVGTPPPPPANDNCATAVSLTPSASGTCAVSISGTTLSATASVDVLTPCTGVADDDVWYSFVATSAAHTVTLSNVVSVGSTSSTALNLQVLSGTCGALTSILCDTTSVSPATLTGLTVGNTYFVRVYNNATGSLANANTFNICVTTTPPPPGNDDCAGATVVIPNSTPIVGATVSATQSTGTAPTCAATAIDDDVWYSFTATSTTHLVNVLYSDNATATQVYSGSCGSLVAVACFSGAYGNSNVLLSALTVGNTYYVRVYSTSTTVGVNSNFTIAVTTPTAPTNDTCATATAIACGGTVTGNNALAGDETLPTSTCGGTTTTASYKGVWYTVTAVANGPITIDACGSKFDSYLRVYTGSCAALTCFANTDGVGYADAGCTVTLNNAPKLTFTGVAGTTYYVLFSSYAAAQMGDYSLAVTQNCTILATAEVVKNENLKAYPNPFTDVLNISDVKNVKSVSIVDIAGRLVKTIEKPSSALQLRDLNSGMYMVILNMNDGSRQTIKAIKK